MRTLVGALALLAASAEAQSVGSLAADRARLAEVTGDSALYAERPSGRFLAPEVRLVWNSALPFSLNDGPLWAGRGPNASLMGGLAWEFSAPRVPGLRGATLRITAAPALTYSRNLPFQIIPNATPGRSDYANPFHGPEASLDLPHRFGDRPLLAFHPGRSSLVLRWPAVMAGVTAENDWWGPGIRNALVVSNNAPGIPRWFVRTARPFATRLGSVDAQLVGGTLTQSPFFRHTQPGNRTFSGAIVQLRPAADSLLTVGISRVVYAPIGPRASPFTLTLARSFDALVRWEYLTGPDSQRSDQIGALFARWVFPEPGLEVYGEWARMDLPRSPAELFVAPHHTGAWTLGMQWAQRRAAGSYLRLQSEFTYLEQSVAFPNRPTPDFYSGQASPQGYTQRGQVVGAAIGPGASSQWIALDWIAPAGQAGGFVGRIRWDNDAMYRRGGANLWDHDVTLFGGVRAARRTRAIDVATELTVGRRINYLFQNGIAQPGGYRTVDVDNVTLSLVATPR